MAAKWIPCQTAGPTRAGRPAPVYWATKVETYPAVTWSNPNGSQYHMTAGNDAAISRESCQASRIVSRNTWTVMKLWLTTSGSASVSSSRLPPGTGSCGLERPGTPRGSVGMDVGSAASKALPL